MAIRNLAHAQRMFEHAAQQKDPRDPDVRPAPEPGTFFLQFRRELAASEQISVLSRFIANVHALYEGWNTQNNQPTERHVKAAELAIRYCSAPAESAAMTAAQHYALTALERLQERTRSCDMTASSLEFERKMIVVKTLDIYIWHLTHEGGRSAMEMQQLEETPLEDPDGE